MAGDSQTNLQEIDETHCAFQLENASNINHICVFLLGTGVRSVSDSIGYTNTTDTVPFPAGYAATVHFFWPGKGFQLLGMSVPFRRFHILPLTLHPGSLTTNLLRSSASGEHSAPQTMQDRSASLKASSNRAKRSFRSLRLQIMSQHR